MAISSPRDDNRIPAIVSVSSSDGTTPVSPWTDPSTHRLLVDAQVTTTPVGNQTVTIINVPLPVSGSVSITAGSVSVTNIARTVAGSVSITAGTVSLGAGTQSIGTLGANSGVDIGDVTLTNGSNLVGSVTVNQLPSLPAGSNLVGSVSINSLPALASGSNTVGSITVTNLARTVVGSVSITAGTVSVGQGTVNIAVLPALVAGNALIGSVTVNSLPSVTVGTMSALVAGNALIGSVNIAQVGGVQVTNNALPVQGSVSITAGTVGISSIAAGSNAIGSVTIVAVAAGVADSGNPIKIGAVATTTLSSATLYGTGQRVNLVADLDGALVVRPYGANGDIVFGTASITTKAATQVIAAQAASVKTYLTSVTISNTGTTSVNVEAQSGTTKYVFPAPCGTAGIGMAGMTHNFGPVGLPGNAATAWNFLPSATTTLTVSAVGYNSKA